MKKEILRTEKYSLASIVDEKSPIAYGVISIDFHSKHTATGQALSLVYTEALLSGAGRYSRSEFLNALNLLGASLDVKVSANILTITMRSTEKVFKQVINLLELALTDPHFDAKELKRIQKTTINELVEDKENSKLVSCTNLLNSVYGEDDRHYNYPIDDLIKEVNKINVKKLRELHSKLLKHIWHASVLGKQKIVTMFTNFVKSNTKNGGFLTDGKHHQKTTGSTLILNNIPSKQNIDFSIGGSIPFTLHHPDYIPLMFGVAVLGKWGGFTGRLMSTVREKEGLTYGIYVSLSGFSGSEQGYWRIMTFFAPEKTKQGITSTFREVNKIFKEGISDDEFETFKNILSTGQILMQDSTIAQLRDLHSYNLHGFTVTEMEEHKQLIFSVSKEDVDKAVKTYLNPRHLVVSGAGPVTKVEKDIKSILRKV